jgi:hypothetical protein
VYPLSVITADRGEAQAVDRSRIGDGLCASVFPVRVRMRHEPLVESLLSSFFFPERTCITSNTRLFVSLLRRLQAVWIDSSSHL